MVVALVENLLDLGSRLELKSYPSLSVIEYKSLENFLLQLMNLNIFICLLWVLAVVLGIFSCIMGVESGSLRWD